MGRTPVWVSSHAKMTGHPLSLVCCASQVGTYVPGRLGQSDHAKCRQRRRSIGLILLKRHQQARGGDVPQPSPAISAAVVLA